MIPNDRQKEHILRVASEPTHAALINLGTGWGKTLLALDVFSLLRPVVDRVLVIAPLNTKGGWRAHAAAMLPDLPFLVIESGKNEENYAKLKAGTPGVYFVTKDYLALSGTSAEPKEKDDGTFTRGRIQKHRWDMHLPMVVLDESHKTNHRDTAGYKVLRRLDSKWRIAMSATPAGNKFDRLWETCRWLWPDLIDRSKSRWVAEWCRTEYDPYKYDHKKVVGEKVPGAFVGSLPCYITDEADFKVPVRVVNVSTPMTAEQRKQYDAMKRDSLLWIDEHPLVADLPIVQKIRLRQIALGEVVFDEDGDVNFADDCKSSKIRACELICARHPGEQVLFYTDSKRFAYVLAKRLGGRAWTGDLSSNARDQLKADFIAGRVRYIVAVISAFGTGTDGLHLASSTEVFCNQSFNGVDNEQCEGRLNRRGQKAKEITRYMLTAPDSGDVLDFEKLLKNRQELRRSL